MMAYRERKITREKFFTLFLPLFIFILTLFVSGFYLINPKIRAQAQNLKANIGDGKFKKDEMLAYFNNQEITAPKDSFKEPDFLRVLSLTTPEQERQIEINLSEQRLYAYEGETLVYDFPISSGKWGLTPTGEFRIWAKLKYTLMHGGSRHDNTYYYLPNVPYTQYFYHGYGIHGTYWHNNFGHPMSHGCINMYTPDAETLFYWTNPPVSPEQWVVYPESKSMGTAVIVKGVSPRE